jgi:predicted DNA-binding WGR domain protein
VSERAFEYSDGKSFKFWKIDLKGTSVLTRYGRIGSDGQETNKSFKSADEAQKAYDKLVAEKLGKGYVETKAAGKPAGKKAAATKAAPAKAAPASKAAPAKAAKAAKPAKAASGKREFHFLSGNSSKFWAIELKGKSFEVTYGRLGTAGTTQSKAFASEDVARQNYDKLIAEKTAKGYVEVGGGTAAPSKAAASANGAGGPLSPMMFSTTRSHDFDPISNFIGERVTQFREKKPTAGKSVFRVGVSYDEDEESDGGDTSALFNQRLAAFLASDAAPATKGLLIGNTVMYDATGLEKATAELVKQKDRLPNLQALFLGDITQEESEISWIEQSDISPLLAAFPKLEMLRVRGSTKLQFSKPSHAKLRALAIESGGLPAKIVGQICRGKFPELEYLELWLGTPDYNGDCRVNDLQPILKGKLFPKLKYLGLRNSQIADDIAAVIVKSPIIDQLETLDLSLGNLSDEGANALLQLADKKNLKRLDLHRHYISKPVQKKLKALPFPVDLADAQSVDEDDEFSGRFVAIGE